MKRYTVIIRDQHGGWEDRNDRCDSLQSCIEHILQEMGCCSNNEVIDNAQITIVETGHDGLVDYKDPDDALEDLIASLARASVEAGELVRKTANDWIEELNDKRNPNRRRSLRKS